MPIAAVNGINLSYTDSASPGGRPPGAPRDAGDGQVIVLSHGILMDQSMFDDQVAALSPHYRVITWDERGHGATLATGPFSYWDSAKDVLALLDHLGVQT